MVGRSRRSETTSGDDTTGLGGARRGRTAVRADQLSPSGIARRDQLREGRSAAKHLVTGG
jgi:hypothetical protein